MKYLMISITLAVLIFYYSPATYGQVVRDNLIANWPFDRATIIGDTIKDIAGKYDAKMKGGPKIVVGKYGEAIEFNGKDNYIELTTLPGFGTHLANFSVDFWLKTPSTPDWTTLFKSLTDGSSMGWAIDLNRSAKPGFAYSKNTTHFYVRDSKGKQLPSEINADIYDNSWHHIGWVVENAKSNTCKIYIDGKVQDVSYGDAQSPAEFIDFQHPIYLGAANNRGNIERFCPAVVDEFRIYTKALTEQEIQRNMASGAAIENSGKLSITWGELKFSK